MSNRLARLYNELRLISTSREVTMMVQGKPTAYNLHRGQEVIEQIIAEEKISEHKKRLVNDPLRGYSPST